MEIKKKLTVLRGEGGGITGEKWRRVIKEYVQWTHGQSQSGIGLRVGVHGAGEIGGWKMETTVIEQE